MPTLPSTAATCERTRCVTSSTKASKALSSPRSFSLAAIAGAVMAGCLVASVQCSNWIMTKLAAYITPDHRPLQNAVNAKPVIKNFSHVVSDVTAPPPAALTSMPRYSARSRVM